METGRNFQLFAGLLYSTFSVEDNEKYPYLRPQFAHVTHEVHNEAMSWENYEKYVPLPLSYLSFRTVWPRNSRSAQWSNDVGKLRFFLSSILPI